MSISVGPYRGMIFLRGIEGYVNCEAGVENNALQLQRDS
jgi:hypothetical protein